METIEKDLRHGRLVLRIDVPEDLWHLGQVLQPGDVVKSRTMRKVSVKQGGEMKMGDKKPMTLAIALEKSGFDETTGALRLTGRIVEGPEDAQLSSYHTLQVEPGTTLTITKRRWSQYQLRRIEESRERQPKVLVCVLDREEADIAMVQESGIRLIARIDCRDPEDRDGYHSEILKLISMQQGWDKAVVAGPGFEAENLLRFAKGANPDIASKALLEHCSHTGVPGITEVLKRSGERILKESRIGKESRLVEEVLSRIHSGGLVTYGKGEAEKAVGLGAVETLIVSREKLADFEGLMERCESMGGRIAMVTADHQLGEQFLHIGGIAAFLRFRLEYQ